MTPEDSLKFQLSTQIASANTDAAKGLARRMPPGTVGSVLETLSIHDKAAVRILVLEIAAEIASDGACRAILGRLQDANLTVRSLANSLIGGCGQKTVVPHLFQALDQDLDVRVKGELARRIGIIGDPGDVPLLLDRYKRAREPKLRDALAAAMARLGDFAARGEIVRRLADPDVGARVAALRDIEYVGDRGLAVHLRTVLDDRRDALVMSLPHDPLVMARVCDLTVRSLTVLGWPLSFRVHPLRRFSEVELAEASSIVAAMQTGQ